MVLSATQSPTVLQPYFCTKIISDIMINSLSRICLRTIITLVMILPLPVTAEVSQSPLFNRLMIGLESAAPETRSRFASIALSRLAQTYQTEALAAYRTPENTAFTPPHWTRAVESHALHLHHIRERVELGDPVTLVTQDIDSPMIVVGTYRVMLSHPQLDQQPAFEHQLVEAFCQQENCRDLLPEEDTVAESMSGEAINTRIRPHWQFTNMGPVCSYSDIHISFAKDTNIQMMRSQCNTLFTELEMLLEALRWQRNHGVEIDWKQLTLTAMPGGQQHLLNVNKFDDGAVVTLPLFFDIPQLVTWLTPWLKARMADVSYPIGLRAHHDPQRDKPGFFSFEPVSE